MLDAKTSKKLTATPVPSIKQNISGVRVSDTYFVI